MKTPSRIYYVSDYAYSRLLTMAQQGRFVSYGASKARGMSRFIDTLSYIPMDDTRPDLVRRRHEEEIRNNRAPTWLHIKIRRARLLTITDDTIARLLLVAHQVGIIGDKPFAVGGPKRNIPYPIVALVIEAIGLGWITPEYIPHDK